MCTIMFETQPDALSYCVWHVPKQLCHNSGKYLPVYFSERKPGYENCF